MRGHYCGRKRRLRLLLSLGASCVLSLLFTGRILSANTDTASPWNAGVVVEELGDQSSLAAAGIQIGDTLLSWERLVDSRADSEDVHGDIESPFDWMWIKVEQAPRGVVRLYGIRASQMMSWLVPLEGTWDAVVRPRMPPDILGGYENAVKLIKSGQAPEGAIALRQVVKSAKSVRYGYLECWLLLRMGETLGEAKAWADAHASYQEALALALEPRSEVAIWEAIGGMFLSQNQFDLAQGAFLSALKIREQISPGGLGVANVENFLGTIEWYRVDLKAAEPHYQRVIDIRERLVPGSLELATGFNNLGNVLALRGDLPSAEEHYLRALALREQLAPESLDLASTINNLGNIAAFRGELAVAEARFRRALEIKEKLDPESLDVAMTLGNLGLVLEDRGDLSSAETYLQRALKLQRMLSPNGLEVADTYNNLGTIKENLSDLAGAETYYRLAVGIWERLAPQSLSLAVGINNLGNVAMSRGNLIEAENYFLEANTIREVDAPDSLEQADSLQSLGLLAWLRNDATTAERFYQRSLAIRKKSAPGGVETAACYTNLANIYSGLGQFDLSIAYDQQALSIWEKAAPDSLGVATALNNLGATALKQGVLDMAKTYGDRALDIRLRKAPQSFDTAINYNLLGNIARARGDLLSAVDFQKRALEIWGALAPNSTREAITLYSLGALYRTLGNVNRSVEFFGRSTRALERQIATLGGSDEQQGNFQARHRDFYREAIDVLLAEGRTEEAFFTLERSRARTFLVMLAERDLAFSADLSPSVEKERRSIGRRYDNALKKLEAASRRESIEEVEGLRQELAAILKEHDDIASRIRRESPKFASLQFPDIMGVAQAKNSLDPGTVLLSYSVGEKRTHLFVLAGNEELKVITLPFGEAELRHSVEIFLATLERAKNPARELFGSFRLSGQQLFDMLIRPAFDSLRGCHRLLILPDGPLHRLPFGALVRKPDSDDQGSEFGWQYLAEWKPIHMALSATVYATLRELRHSSSEDSRPVEVVAFGDPDYPGSQQDATHYGDVVVRSVAERTLFDWAPLPYSRREVEGITGIYPVDRARTYLGAAATEEQAKAIGRDVRILHFAVHSHLDERFPLNSFLALSIPREVGEGQDNGLLQVWEILERVRIDADLVVLSACESGLGQELGGEGLIGLTRAFQYAGARSVVASLWSVADRATSELMIRFYRHLRSGLPKDEALRAAQLEFIREPIEVLSEAGEKTLLDVSSPYYWAAFQVYGDWE